MRNWDSRYAARADRITASEIRELLKLLGRPGIISFAGGIPDPALFPRETIAAAYARILSEPATAGLALQYASAKVTCRYGNGWSSTWRAWVSPARPSTY